MSAGGVTTERGNMTPLSLIVFAFVVLFAMGFTRIGAAMIVQARAQNAADSAALAGAVEGESTAMLMARRNGAELTAFDVEDQMVTVTVSIGSIKATASATPISVQ